MRLLFLPIHRQLTAADGSRTRVIKFDAIEIQGGGVMEVQSRDVDGLYIECDTILIGSGAVLTADRLHIQARHITVEQSGDIDLSNLKVCRLLHKVLMVANKL